jgi:ADP-heptose:LPS heptosyltransferase
MCTPLLREIKQANPACRTVFCTAYTELLRGLPFVDELRRWPDECPANAINLSYERSIPPRRHIARILGDRVGVAVKDVRPSCIVDPELLKKWQQRWRSSLRPIVVVNRSTRLWTPNKDWPDPYWHRLLDRLCLTGSVVEIGEPGSSASQPQHPRYLDLRGQTSLPELVAVIASADIHVGPVSGPVHIAAAFNIPAVVIYGGYEDPICSAYPGNINLYTKLRCSPCWLRTPCPYDKECLRRIEPATVVQAVEKLWNKVRSP